MPTIIGSSADLRETVGDLYALRQQELPAEYMAGLKEQADNFKWNLNGYTRVASVPQAIADKWLSEGFDIWSAPAKEIVKRLKMEEYDTFVLSGSRGL